MDINLAELSAKSGKSEVEIAKMIAAALNIKAEVTGKEQKIILSITEG